MRRIGTLRGTGRHRGDVDNSPVTAARKFPRRRVTCDENRADHDVERFFFPFPFAGRKFLPQPKARVIDEQTDGTRMLRYPARNRTCVVVPRQICREDLHLHPGNLAQVMRNSLQTRPVTRHEHEVISFGRELPRKFQPEAGAGAGNKSTSHNRYGNVPAAPYTGVMRIATWNINSVRARAERARAVLERWDLDALLLQETKCTPAQFPREIFEAAGYEVACTGLNQWNGVAILSRVGIANVQVGFPGQPGFSKVDDDGALLSAPTVEARALGARLGTGPDAVTVWSLYIPNGRAYGDPHFHYKLEFLEALRAAVSARLGEEPDYPLLLAGDWNVAPRDTDVWDIDYFRNDVGMYVTAEERGALAALLEAGVEDITRAAEGADYTFWDYQRLRFPKNHGMRIDFGFASPALAARHTHSIIDREERKGKGASDHVPVIMEFAD